MVHTNCQDAHTRPHNRLDFTTQPQAEAFATYLQQHFGVEHDSQCRCVCVCVCVYVHCVHDFTALYGANQLLNITCITHSAQHPAVRMEITPAYMFHPLVPTRVQQHLPEVCNGVHMCGVHVCGVHILYKLYVCAYVFKVTIRI